MLLKSIFNRNRPQIDWIKFETFGWGLKKEDNQTQIWESPDYPVMLSLHYFNQMPDIPLLSNTIELQEFYRKSAVKQGGGIIKVETAQLDGLAAVETIVKIPMNPKGTYYIGSITLPFKKHSYVVKVQAAEVNDIGQREKVLMKRLLNNKMISKDQTGKLIGWERDPYNPFFADGLVMNKGENVEYDKEFYAHPLSVVRDILKKIIQTMNFDKNMFEISKF